MKLLLLSDCHLSAETPISRTDDLCKTQMNKLKFIFDYVEENEINEIVQAGDLFHSPRSWYLLEEFIDLYNKYDNLNISNVYGQHDTYSASIENRGATNLGILHRSEIITLLDHNPLYLDDNTCVYGASWNDEVPEPEDLDLCNILVIHEGIGTEDLYPGQNRLNANNFLRKHKFDLILCGDIHQSFSITDKNGRSIVNTGPLLRREATEYNFTHKPNFIVYDTKTKGLETVYIPCEPAEKILNRDHIEINKERKEILSDFTKEILDSYKKSSDFDENLKSFLNENKKEISNNVLKIISKYMEGELK